VRSGVRNTEEMYMNIPQICLRCSRKTCHNSSEGQIGFCEYDVAFIKAGKDILRREALVPLRNISTNLRHALNPILNLIVEQTVILDPDISIKKLDVNTPLGKILAASLIIDRIIQILTGVNEFHPGYVGEKQAQPKKLSTIIHRQFHIYSILKSVKRPTDLNLLLNFEDNIFLTLCPDIYEYLVSIFMDNSWKFSLPKTSVEVNVSILDNCLAKITFTNISLPIPKNINIFGKGEKGYPDIEGFGYGLFWGTILVDYYNRIVGKTDDLMEVSHRETVIEGEKAIQEFTLNNCDINIARK